jgi:hypothetical protein
MVTTVNMRDGRDGDVAVARHRVVVTPVGLRIPAAITYETWVRVGQRIVQAADLSAWCLGDWMIYGQTRYNGRCQHAIRAAGLDYETLRNYAWVARSIELPRRRAGLSFQHHAEVAALSARERDYWLDQAEKFGWSSSQLWKNVRDRSKDKPGSHVGLPRMSIASERIERWRLAAAKAHRDLESWIITQLDAAADGRGTR